MEISFRLDTMGFVEVLYLRTRERYRDWPHFQLIGASRQARVFAYFNREVAEQLHQQILMIEATIGLEAENDDEDDEEEGIVDDDFNEDAEENDGKKASERGEFSPAFAQALKQLNELAHQRLPEERSNHHPFGHPDSEDYVFESLQDAFGQMMGIVQELAVEFSTDTFKFTSRLEVARTNIEFLPRPVIFTTDEDEDEGTAEADLLTDEDDDDEDEDVLNLELELTMVLQLFEKGRAKLDDLPAIELQLDVDDFEHLHDTLDTALERERRGRRRR